MLKFISHNTKSKIINHKSKIISHSLTFFKGNSSGYSLYLVLIVLVIAGVLFSITLKSSLVAHVFSVRHVQSLQAKLLAHSGIARAEYFLNGGDGHDLFWETDRFEEKVEDFGNIILSCIQFGAFVKVTSIGKRLKKEYVLEGLMGRDVPKNISPVITLTGHVGGLVLAKGTTINGNVVLHHGTVKRGSNKSPIPNSHTWVKQQESPPLPFDIQNIKSFMESSKNKISSSMTDKKALQGNMYLSKNNDSILAKVPLIINGNCDITDIIITNASIIASGEVTIRSNVICKGSMFLCNKLAINDGTTYECLFFSNSIQNIKGGKHSSQFFCNDSIIIGSKAKFDIMSLWVSNRVQNSDTTLTGGIIFPENRIFNGHAICYTDSIVDKSNVRVGPAIVLGQGCTFNGCLITDGDINIKRIIANTHIWARSIVAVEDKMSYKNWLLGCKLKALDKDIPFPLLGDLPAKVSLLYQGL